MTVPAIRTTRLTKSYGLHRGVVDIDLEVQPGEVFGYLGPDGAGKTTTIRLLLDLIQPTSGRIELLGLDSRRDGITIRRRLGYLPTELDLYGRLTGIELVRFFGRLRGGVDEVRVRDIADRLGCVLHREIRTLSIGDRQKVALVQAFMNDAPLLILDEPATGLDALAQGELRSLIGEARHDGRTVFLSSGVPTEVELLCDRVAVVREGRLIATERVQELQERAVRRVEIHFASPVPEAAFVGLPGVEDAVVDDSIMRCATHGSVAPLMHAASQFEIVDILSTEPGLEEVFAAMFAGAGWPAPSSRPARVAASV
jgi:ABC-2 type transport system ATP-binding protein